MSASRRLTVALYCFLLCCPLAATAGFDEALRAFQAKDYPTALTEARQAAAGGDARGNFLLGFMHQNGLGVPANPSDGVALYEKAAQGGVVGAFSKLAQAHARGDGVARDTDKALGYARRAAQLGDPEGTFFLFVILNSGALGYLDAKGKPDAAKYDRLATRPLADRALDTEARDALYRAAARGYPLAEMMLAMTLAGTIGDGNRERMLALMKKAAGANATLQNYQKIAQHMDRLGNSYASPQLFFDAQAPQMFAGMIKTCGIRDPKDGPRPAPPELTAIAVSKPLTGAVYLPSGVAGNERSYLLAGEWEEDWTYRGCDKSAVVKVRFVADGLGGARFFSEQTAKEIPGAAKQ